MDPGYAGAATAPPGATVAGHAPPSRRSLGGTAAQAALTIAVPLACLALASVLSLAAVRVGADLRLGLDPFASGAARPILSLRELAGRGLAIDALRAALVALLVVGVARWRRPDGWRERLALAQPTPAGRGLARLWWLLPVWPILHIAWVTASAEALHVGFAHGVRLSPFLSPVMVACWLGYVGLLAPLAEELLLRGETFARARAFLRPWGAIAVTALLFCLAHVSEAGLARPVTLLPLAVALGWLRWRTGRLWPCVLLHGWSNLAMVAYVLWPGMR